MTDQTDQDQPDRVTETHQQQRLVLILAVVGAVIAAALAAAAVVAAAVVVWATTCGPPAPIGPQPSAAELSPVWATTPCGAQP